MNQACFHFLVGLQTLSDFILSFVAAGYQREAVEEITPVSYTHLDVYKRQAHPEDAKSYDTKRIRRDFLIEKVFSANEVNMVYSCLLYTSGFDMRNDFIH